MSKPIAYLKLLATAMEARTAAYRTVRIAESLLKDVERMRNAGDWLSQLAPDTDDGKRAVAEWNEAREVTSDE